MCVQMIYMHTVVPLTCDFVNHVEDLQLNPSKADDLLQNCTIYKSFPLSL